MTVTVTVTATVTVTVIEHFHLEKIGARAILTGRMVRVC